MPDKFGSISKEELALTQLQISDRALRVFFKICADWGVSQEQESVILGEAFGTVQDWKTSIVPVILDQSTLERLSYLFRIYSALEILLPIPERASKWVKAVNTAPLFGGGTALQLMLSGNVVDLNNIANYLEVTVH